MSFGLRKVKRRANDVFGFAGASVAASSAAAAGIKSAGAPLPCEALPRLPEEPPDVPPDLDPVLDPDLDSFLRSIELDDLAARSCREEPPMALSCAASASLSLRSFISTISAASSSPACSCRAARVWKTPRSWKSSSYVPSSIMTPFWTTAILSAPRIVERRCAIVIVVRFCFVMISSSAACTTFSEALSRADVASSSSSTAGFLMIARAMATRCFCPPLSLPPPWPTCVQRAIKHNHP